MPDRGGKDARAGSVLGREDRPDAGNRLEHCRTVQSDSEVERVADFDCRYCIASLRREAVYVARRPRRPLAEVWPELKNYQ